MMYHSDFVYKTFRAENWEPEVKTFIETLYVQPNLIWFKKNRVLKKVSEELITLGYYVTYKYGPDDSISFRLNRVEGAVDGWILQEGKEVKSVQIVIAYYEEDEAKQDELLMSGAEVCTSGWRFDRLETLEARVKQRIQMKVDKGYADIDVLVVGVKGWFVRSSRCDYLSLKNRLEETAGELLARSQFKELAIVDTDLVGKGELLLFSNESIQRTR